AEFTAEELTKQGIVGHLIVVAAGEIRRDFRNLRRGNVHHGRQSLLHHRGETTIMRGRLAIACDVESQGGVQPVGCGESDTARTCYQRRGKQQGLRTLRENLFVHVSSSEKSGPPRSEISGLRPQLNGRIGRKEVVPGELV